jgi:hypothetical protein
VPLYFLSLVCSGCKQGTIKSPRYLAVTANTWVAIRLPKNTVIFIGANASDILRFNVIFLLSVFYLHMIFITLIIHITIIICNINRITKCPQN